MRVALLRGSLLRPWELQNYVLDGVDVEIFTSRTIAGRMAPTGVPLRGLWSVNQTFAGLSPRVRGLLDLTAGNLEYLAGLERALSGFDIAHALELHNPLTWQALRAREQGRVGAVVSSVMENIAFARTPNPLVQRRVDRVAAGVDHFIAITERARLHLTTAGVDDERITVLPVGIPTDRFRPDPQRPSRSGDRLRILSVARLEPGKGVEDLAVAVGLLSARGVDCEVTFVGEGPSAPRIAQIAAQMGVADRVTMRTVPWEELDQVHRRHDVFVLASAPTTNWREQFGFAVVEAMASGLPALVGDSGSLREVVGRTDQLVPPHDPLALADRLQELAADEPLRRELGAYNRRRAEERFDLAVARRGLLEVYDRVLARTSSSRSRSPSADHS